MTPSISMLLPARGRPENLRASVASVFDLAADPDRVEVLIRLDDDDRHIAAELRALRDLGGMGTRILVETGARLGYAQMHGYYNGLAARALGEWLYLWNDDIEGLTPRWDDLLRDAPPFSVQWPRRDITTTTDFTLPVLGRPVYDAIGHVSVNAYCDAWIADCSGYAGASIIRDDIAFVHHRLNDETLVQQQDGNVEWSKFSAEEQLALRRADRDAILGAPGYGSRFDGWRTEARYLTLDYLNLEPDRRPRAYVLLGRA